MDENADGGVVTSVATENATSVTVDDDRFEIADGNLKLTDGTTLDFESDSSPIEVTITASGDGASATHTVSVSINDVDEAPSAPMVRDAELSVDENDAGATLSSLADSTDPEGDAVSYSVSDDRFEITSGLILKLKDGESLDYEEDGASVDLVITASDPAGNTSETTVTVTVGNVNEAPEVTADDHAVDENMAGVGLGAITPNDPDGDTLTVEVSGDARFEARQDDQGGWWVALKDGESLNYETEQSVDLMVTVTDPDGLSASADVTVTVNDVNEAPEIMVGEASVAENDAGADVAAVSATDVDMGDTHTFEVSDNRFEVAGGMLKLKDGESLNHEAGAEVMVTVTVTDDGDPAMSDSAEVTISVTDANDDPMFARDSYAFNLSENEDGSTTAVSLGMVSASDEDAADTHMFSITGGNDDGLFAIDSATGEISYVGTGEDYRSSVTGPSHTLTIEVSDGTSSDEASVAITILNANDAPEFGASSYTFDLAENADGSTTAIDLGMVSATDSDEGDAVEYSITAGNDDGLFAIDSASGAITYVGTGEDAESGAASHELTVSASDGSATSEVMVTVNVTNANDSTPMFGEDSYAFDLAENADGSTTAVEVGMVSATDSDGDTLEYSISSGNDDGLFAIDSASGAITYVGMGENYESDTMSHELMVEASDGANSDSATVTVSVTDANDAPMADAEMMIGTFALVNGAEGSMDVDLGALFSDEDGDTLTYTLSSDQDWLSLAVTTDSDGSVTGSVHGTPPDDGNNIEAMVTIVATDPDGGTGEATFYVVVDAENAAPSSVKLRQTDDGVTSVVTAVKVAENAMGASFGSISVEDVDNAMHPHGQHMFTFEVDGVADDRFEVVDGMLKLKDDQALDYEEFTDGEFELTVTATDMAEGEAAGSTSMTLDVTVTDTSDGPVAQDIGDWWVTVDDRLDAEDAREGEWLSFVLRTTGEDAAFTDEDSDTLSYSISVADANGNAVDWLQINANTGAMTNKEGMVPEAGVYTVTVTATDEDDNSASASFKLAVAVGDLDNSDNDRPNIRDVVDYDYTEGSGSARLASFEVSDDDIAIAPHPYGTLEVKFTAMQGTTDVSDRFKLVEIGDNGDDTAQYEIHHKSADELFVKNADGTYKLDAMDKKIPIKPIDYEMGDEVEFTVTATDGQGEMDDQTIRVDIEDAADTAPMFSQSSISGATRKVDPMTKAGTTTLAVDQQDTATVVVVQLGGRDGVWSDPDTDVDDLDFNVGGKGGLPDWIKVYGPDDWEDIYTRRDDVDRRDGPSTLRDRDPAIAIVIDHSKATGSDLSPGKALGSFTLTARDPEGNTTTETISIDVKDINVGIPAKFVDDVVTITGDPDGTGSLEMVFDQDLDPDFAAGGVPVLVLYTWSHDNATPADTSDDVIISVSTSPQPLPLFVDANGDGIPDVDGSGNVNRVYTTAGDATLTHTITAKVDYYEVNPDGTISVVSRDAEAEVAADTTATPRAVPAVSTTPTDVTFHITTSATGLSVIIGATGEAAEATGTARLEVSTNGTSGWITEVGEQAADTSSGVTAAIGLNVNANSDANSGDGGGLYYRVVYTYRDENNRPMEEISEVVDQLGNVTATTGNGDPTPGANATLGNATAVGGTIRADTQGNPAEVQWQMWVDADRDGAVDANEWVDITGETGVSLTITNDYVGSQLRAKVTYTHEDNPATTNVNENGWIRWVETTAPLAGPADPANVLPSRLQSAEEIRVNITQTADSMGVKSSVDGHGSGTVAGLFFDTDGDTLTYNLAGPAGLTFEAGGTVYVSGDLDGDAANGDQTQTLAIDGETGAITYYTNSVTTHDAAPGDGLGNTLVVEVNANDGTGDTADDVTVTVRINVSPTAINDAGAGAALAATEAAAAPLATAFSIDETAGVTSAQATALGAIVSLDVQDQNLVTDDYGTHTVTVMSKQANGKFAPDGRFEVTHNGGGRTDSDNNGSTWEVRVKEGAKFDYESTANPMGVVTIKVTATDGGGHSVDSYFTIAISDVGGTGGNKATDDPHYRAAPTSPPTKPPEEPETPGLKDDSDDSDEDGAVPPDEDEGPEPGDGGMFIDDLIGDDLLGDYVLAIDDIDIA